MISLSYDNQLARVQISAEGMPALATSARVERSPNAISWKTIRGAAEVPLINGAFGVLLSDYEFLADVTNYYRITPSHSGVEDSFSRTESGIWGTSDTGHTYVVTANKTGAVYNVDGSRGTIELGASDLATRAALQRDGSPLIAGDIDATVTVSSSAVATGEALVGRILGRFVNPSNFYACNIAFSHDGNVYIELDIVEGGVGNHFDPPVSKGTYAADDEFTIRFQTQGSALRVKLWPAGTTEPVDWDIDVSDSTFSNPGGVSIRTDALPGNTNTDPVISYDNLQVQYTPSEPGDRLEGAIQPNLQGQAWLKSVARPFLNTPITPVGDVEVSRRSRSGVFDVMGRTMPVAVTDVASSREMPISFLVSSEESRNRVDLIAASGDIVYFHVPKGSPTKSMYAVMGDIVHTHGHELLSVHLTEVAAPGPDVVGNTATWQAVLNNFPTWQDVLNFFPTWADVLEYVADPEEVIVE